MGKDPGCVKALPITSYFQYSTSSNSSEEYI